LSGQTYNSSYYRPIKLYRKQMIPFVETFNEAIRKSRYDRTNSKSKLHFIVKRERI
jgi:hypothetical protein